MLLIPTHTWCPREVPRAVSLIERVTQVIQNVIAALQRARWGDIHILDALLDDWLDVFWAATVGPSLSHCLAASNVAIRLKPDWVAQIQWLAGTVRADALRIVLVDFNLRTGLVFALFIFWLGRFLGRVLVVQV